jgi:glycosyltransferase involved in cell wall biosynthesis
VTLGKLPTYVVISPVRDEGEHLAQTAEALVSQTHRPSRWIIVDDASRDATVSVARRYADAHDWIEVLSLTRAGERRRGEPVVAAFDAGRGLLSEAAEITVKLDGHVVMPPAYFERIAEVFARRPAAGIVGGVVEVPTRHGWRRDRVSSRNVHGAIKAYRTRLLEEIGLQLSLGWDGIDGFAARARGWEVCVLPDLRVRHLRRRGGAQPWYRARWEEGRGAWAIGYLPPFMVLRCAYRMVVEHPPALGGIVLGAGYVAAAVRQAPRVDDALAIRALREEQRERVRHPFRAWD